MRAGASPIGAPAFHFVLSGERATPARDAFAKAGAPRKTIVSDFVGIVHRGTDAADHAVIVDATMRHALANGDKQMAGPQATPKRICALQKDMAAL